MCFDIRPQGGVSVSILYFRVLYVTFYRPFVICRNIPPGASRGTALEFRETLTADNIRCCPISYRSGGEGRTRKIWRFWLIGRTGFEGFFLFFPPSRVRWQGRANFSPDFSRVFGHDNVTWPNLSSESVLRVTLQVYNILLHFFRARYYVKLFAIICDRFYVLFYFPTPDPYKTIYLVSVSRRPRRSVLGPDNRKFIWIRNKINLLKFMWMKKIMRKCILVYIKY